MKTLISGMGTEYKNSELKREGTIERSHRTFNEYVRSYISIEKDDWNGWFRCFTMPSTVYNYCSFELVFSKVPNIFKNFNEVDTITSLNNVDDYAKGAKFRLEITLKRAKHLLDINKIKQKSKRVIRIY